MAAKNYALIDKNQWNVYILVPTVVLGIICLTVLAVLLEDIRKESVVGILGLVALLSKGPGYKNAAKSVVKNNKEEDEEIAHEVLDQLLKKLPSEKLGKLVGNLPAESKEKIWSSSRTHTPDDSSSSEKNPKANENE